MESVIHELMEKLFVEIEASGRHVHLTKEATQILFSRSLQEKRPLSQPGQFLCTQRVSLIGPKGRVDNVAVLGPERSECQVELSMTDCVSLGLKAPVRPSGDVKNAPLIEVEANGKRIQAAAIVAHRHIHMTPQEAEKRGLCDGACVKLRTLTARPVIFEEVTVRVSPNFRTFAHLDYDEANACGLKSGDLGLIV